VTRNSVGWAIDARNGRILWQVLGAPSDSGIAGGPAPALSSQLAVFPFASGQMVAAVKGPGTQIWAASVGGKRLGRAFSRISDLTGDPVVAGETIYAGNHSGRAAAFNATTGQLIWSADEGTLGPVWLAGNALFLISDVNRLVRLDAATGETVWAVDLPFFTRNRISRRKATYAHYGPILAGGRLLVASDDGLLRQFDPTDGALIASLPLPGGAASNPVVAGGTLYLVTENGQLHAFR
jgi:outer membrane protein assembly factor BamB